MTATDFFGPLYGLGHVPEGDEDLLFYWAIPESRDIANFIWDTDVPEVTNPWPTMEPASLRDAMVMVLGSEDVTGHLYSLQDLADYEATRKALVGRCARCGKFCDENPCYGGMLLAPLPPCTNCGLWCDDKWCGLRGDDATQIINGEVSHE